MENISKVNPNDVSSGSSGKVKMDPKAAEKFFSETEKMEVEILIGEDKESMEDLLKNYPHDLQMYRNLPTGHISLVEFENLGAERFKVLQIIDSLSKEIEIKPEEFKECLLNALKCKGLDFYVKLIRSSSGDSNTLADIEARRRDHISHFVLRLSLCRKRKLLDWFLNLEVKLFRMRYNSLNRNGFEKFLALNNFDYPTLCEKEKHENRENLIAVHENIDFDSTVFYKVPYLYLRSLVKSRQIFIKGGIAFVPDAAMIEVVTQSFRDYLRREINSSRSSIVKDSRLEPICQKFSIFTEKVLLHEPNSIPLASLDELSDTSYPLCMRIMHQALRREHHLKNFGRFQYGIFLKLIGVSYNASVDFWKEEFLKKMDLQTFEQKYLYHIKHGYGKVGKKVDYKFLGCNTVIDSKVGFEEYHGCPYKNMTNDSLHTNLQKLGLQDDGIVEIEDLAKSTRYQEACSKCFHLMYKNPPPDMITSPSYFFFCSQNLIHREKHIRKQKEQKLREKKGADKESAHLDMTLNGNPLELSNLQQ